MLQFPAFMTQFPSSERMIPASLLLQHQLANSQNEDELLALEEAEYLDKLNEIKTLNSNIVVIGKTKVDIDKEDNDNDVEDDDDADNAEESEAIDPSRMRIGVERARRHIEEFVCWRNFASDKSLEIV